MIIAIDGYEANVGNRVGIGRYAYEILRNMYEIYASSSFLVPGSLKTQPVKIQELRTKNPLRPRSEASQELDCTFRIYLPEAPREDMPEETAWWQYRIIPFKRLWTFIGLPLALTFDRPRADVIFSPTHYSPRFVAIPKVVSIMDLSYLLFPKLFKASDLAQLTSWTKDSVRRASRILTISKSSKNDIIQAYGTKEDQVVVTYPGLTDSIHMNATKKTSGISVLPKSYILSVGTLQPRKNFEKLIEAYSILRKQWKGKAFPELVIVGKKGWLYEDILAAPKRFGVEDTVKLLDFVSDEALPAIYEKAACFVLPSLYEGFGLPVLEAMSYGVPVVVSNVSSLPEIAGDAGIYVNPNDVGSIIEGMKQVLTEKGTKEERDRVKKGLSRVKLFSWEKAAQETLDVLKKVATEGK